MQALERLEQFFASRPPMAVAVSGGVDSMTLAVVAHRVNPGTQVFHAVSPAVPAQATGRVRRHAAKEGWNLIVIDAGEIEDPDYLANPVNRCYFCKTSLYDAVLAHTELTVASGTNLDDLGDYRPGLIAAEEHQVIHPYIEAGIDKATLRQIAGRLALDDLKDLPAAPCLSSRVTTGIAIDAGLLPLINEVEAGLWELLEPLMPLEAVRCRIREGEVALQFESASLPDEQSSEMQQALALARRVFTDAGYRHQVRRIAIEPYSRGSAFLVETVEVG